MSDRYFVRLMLSRTHVSLYVRPSVRSPVVRSFVRLFASARGRPPVNSSVRPSFRPSLRPSARPSVLPSVRPSIRPFVGPSIRPFVGSSIFFASALGRPPVHQSVRLSVLHPSARPPVCSSVRLLIRPLVCSFARLLVRPRARLLDCPSVRLLVRPSVRLSIRPPARPAARAPARSLSHRHAHRCGRLSAVPVMSCSCNHDAGQGGIRTADRRRKLETDRTQGYIY